MKKSLLLAACILAAASLAVYAWRTINQPDECCKPSAGTTSESSDQCIAKTTSTNLSCKLSSAEMRERKATVIASLKNQLLENKELENGFAFKFNGSDKAVDELTAFIKSERECCDFFTFNLSVSGDKSEAWLQLIGPKEAKEFIARELEM